jgi:His-Xaa-Ser system protein HxsD
MGGGTRENGDLQRSAIVTFSAAAFSLGIIKKAAYRLLDVAVVDFACAADQITCTLAFHKLLSAEAVANVERDFRAEVLDQDLRRTVADETAALRNAVLAYALSKTGLQGNE